MKRNIFGIGALMAALIVGFTGCSDDVIGTEQEPDRSSDESGRYVYLSLGVDPMDMGGTRSQTDYAGSMATEEGNDVALENSVTRIQLRLVDTDGNPLATFDTADPDGSGSVTEVSGNYRAKFKKDYTKLTALFNAANDGIVDAYAYVICNAPSTYAPGDTDPLQTQMEIGSVDGVNTYGGFRIVDTKDEQGNYVREKKGGKEFLMSNADYQTSPEDAQRTKYKVKINVETLKTHTQEGNPYPVNASADDQAAPITIPVQRALARFDLGGDWYTYIHYFDEDGNPLGPGTGETEETGPADRYVQVTVKYIGLANINKKFNLFKETGAVDASTGLKLADHWGYCWSEKGTESVTNGDGPDATTSTLNRWVFDPQYLAKRTALTTLGEPTGVFNEDRTALNGYYVNPIMDDGWIDDGYYRNIQNLLADNNDDVKTNDAITNGNYHIWTYCTPNTIHETPLQKNGITTAVVLAARLNFIKGGLGEGTHREDNDDRFTETPIYCYKGKFYGTNRALLQVYFDGYNTKDTDMKEALRKAMDSQKGSDSDDRDELPLWVYSYEDGDEQTQTKTFTNKTLRSVGVETAEDDTAEKLAKKIERFEAYNALPTREFSKALVEAGFSIYTPINFTGSDDPGDWEYGCLYYYWNRHNDNLNNEVMGDMEFDVVRNNIYKLQLGSVLRLGHPMPRPDIYTDPDPIDPYTDDEVANRYISIDCKVVQWGVRKDDDVTLY